MSFNDGDLVRYDGPAGSNLIEVKGDTVNLKGEPIKAGVILRVDRERDEEAFNALPPLIQFLIEVSPPVKAGVTVMVDNISQITLVAPAGEWDREALPA